jgi:hypothetical protein
LCRCQGLVRRFASGRGVHKVCMKKVTFSDTDEVREYNPEDTPADPLPPDPAEQTLAGKRGRPPKPVELLSPLQLSEKRMKTAEETYHGEKYAVFAKVIELKDRRAWDDHPSVVARLDERLDNQCRKVVELQLEWEARKREWELERAKQTLWLTSELEAAVDGWKECYEALKTLHARNVELAAEKRESIARFGEIAEALDRMDSNSAKMAAIEAKIAANEAEIAANKDRERVLWLRGIL